MCTPHVQRVLIVRDRPHRNYIALGIDLMPQIQLRSMMRATCPTKSSVPAAELSCRNVPSELA